MASHFVAQERPDGNFAVEAHAGRRATRAAGEPPNFFRVDECQTAGHLEIHLTLAAMSAAPLMQRQVDLHHGDQHRHRRS